MNIKFAPPFIESVKDLFRTTFHYDVTEGQMRCYTDEFNPQDIVAQIGILGPIFGNVMLSFSRDNALHLVNRLIGLDRQTIDKDVMDTLGEFVNIVAGHAKARLSQEHNVPLVLGLPSVIDKQDFFCPFQKNKNWLEIPFSGACGSFLLSISLMQVQEDKKIMKALIVDDSQFIRNMIQSALAELGTLECVQAKNGAEAVAATESDQFDIIFMDWNMPTMSGLDAVKNLRLAGKKTPVIMVTTESERTRIVEAIKAGATGYIIKPFDRAALLEKVRSIISI